MDPRDSAEIRIAKPAAPGAESAPNHRSAGWPPHSPGALTPRPEALGVIVLIALLTSFGNVSAPMMYPLHQARVHLSGEETLHTYCRIAGMSVFSRAAPFAITAAWLTILL